jgi:glycosyltransferase involved in cell wall biosynthesis
VIVQPPSLNFPDYLLANPENIGDFEPGSYLLRSGPAPEQAITKRNQRMNPFRYLLFNSSVEARKNLSLMAEAYAQSGLSDQGIHLCVTGKLKNDDYSNAIKEIVSNEPGILLTGYVDEATKLDLYLNALILLSPSLVEGFGIPVLDAACLGLPAVVSDSESHLEIAKLHDFSDTVFTLSPLKSRDWADAMTAFAGLGSQLWHPKQASAERKKRICRYKHYQDLSIQKLQADLEFACRR